MELQRRNSTKVHFNALRSAVNTARDYTAAQFAGFSNTLLDLGTVLSLVFRDHALLQKKYRGQKAKRQAEAAAHQQELVRAKDEYSRTVRFVQARQQQLKMAAIQLTSSVSVQKRALRKIAEEVKELRCQFKADLNCLIPQLDLIIIERKLYREQAKKSVECSQALNTSLNDAHKRNEELRRFTSSLNRDKDSLPDHTDHRKKEGQRYIHLIATNKQQTYHRSEGIRKIHLVQAEFDRLCKDLQQLRSQFFIIQLQQDCEWKQAVLQIVQRLKQHFTVGVRDIVRTEFNSLIAQLPMTIMPLLPLMKNLVFRKLQRPIGLLRALKDKMKEDHEFFAHLARFMERLKIYFIEVRKVTSDLLKDDTKYVTSLPLRF